MLPPKHPIHRILFIDDDEDDFLLFREAVSSVNPAISVSFIGDCDKEPTKFPWLEPDLIFLDLNMPGCNGFECLKKIKQSDLKDVPVVIFTTTRNQADIEQAYQCGATLFLSKPFSFKTLTRSVQELLELDWTQPEAITRAYCTNGQYKAFTIS
jgi:CheY-like chemotaxis protein